MKVALHGGTRCIQNIRSMFRGLKSKQAAQALKALHAANRRVRNMSVQLHAENRRIGKIQKERLMMLKTIRNLESTLGGVNSASEESKARSMV